MLLLWLAVRIYWLRDRDRIKVKECLINAPALPFWSDFGEMTTVSPRF
jgi:hypothetical protein